MFWYRSEEGAPDLVAWLDPGSGAVTDSWLFEPCEDACQRTLVAGADGPWLTADGETGRRWWRLIAGEGWALVWEGWELRGEEGTFLPFRFE